MNDTLSTVSFCVYEKPVDADLFFNTSHLTIYLFRLSEAFLISVHLALVDAVY